VMVGGCEGATGSVRLSALALETGSNRALPRPALGRHATTAQARSPSSRSSTVSHTRRSSPRGSNSRTG
jgi:hypothetical protein